MGVGEIKGRASLQRGIFVFGYFFFGWQQLAGKVAGKAKERTKKKESNGVRWWWWGGGGGVIFSGVFI